MTREEFEERMDLVEEYFEIVEGNICPKINEILGAEADILYNEYCSPDFGPWDTSMDQTYWMARIGNVSIRNKHRRYLLSLFRQVILSSEEYVTLEAFWSIKRIKCNLRNL